VGKKGLPTLRDLANWKKFKPLRYKENLKTKMQTLLYILSILLIINALLLFFSVNRNGTKLPEDLQEPQPPINKRVEEEHTGYREKETNGTTILRNIKLIEQEIKTQNKKREQEPIGEGHNSIV
jgi:hypothetical protein